MGKSSAWALRVQEEEFLRDNIDAEFDEAKSINIEETKQPRATQPLDDLFATFGKIYGNHGGKEKKSI